MEVSNDFVITQAISDEVKGIIVPGTYDLLEIFGIKSVGTNNEQEWDLVIVADDANWFSDATVIPDSLPTSFTALLAGDDVDTSSG